MDSTISSANSLSGWWSNNDKKPHFGLDAIKEAIHRVIDPVSIVKVDDQIGVSQSGKITFNKKSTAEPDDYPILAYAPPLHPCQLGDTFFKRQYGLRYAYIAGAMANGITSTKMVEKMARSGMMGFFGAAGLTIHEIDNAIVHLKESLKNLPFGVNLIHSPNDPELESATAKLFIDRGIKYVSASAYLNLTLPLVYYRVKGIYRDAKGSIVCPNKVIAKVSRIEVARKFFSPPPEKLLRKLVDSQLISVEEANLAESIPVAEALTAEADSGGHTDNRPAVTLLPTMINLRNAYVEKYNYEHPIPIGLAGGIATPHSAAAAFAMGAAYILTGTINQSCIESGTSESVRRMLSLAQQADVTMAPSADMFEMGVKVQVLKRGTLFPLRAMKIYDLYCKYDNYYDIPSEQRLILERDIFRNSFEKEWEKTKSFFMDRDPRQIKRAEENSKHKMALVFRSYLGKSSIWAKNGDISREIDYQIWCGPTMGAFNEWVKASFLENPEKRKTVTLAMNLLYGAAVITRLNWLNCQDMILPPTVLRYDPLRIEEIHRRLEED